MKFRIHCNFLSHSCRKLPAPQKTAFRCKLYMHINHLLFIGSFLALLCFLQNWPCIHLHLIIWELFELPFLVVGHTFCTVAVVRCIFASGELTDHHLWLEFKGCTSFWCWKFKVWSWKCKVCRKMFKGYIFFHFFFHFYLLHLRQLVLKPGSLCLWKTMELEICFLALQELWTFSVLGK